MSTILSEVKRQIDQFLGPRASAPPHRFQVAWDNGHVDVVLHDVQPLACALWKLSVHSSRLQNQDAAGLNDLGQKLAQRIRYLLEPLQVHEIDRERDTVQLRSSPPEREPACVRFFEALLDRQGGVTLVRYEKHAGRPRTQIPAAVTVQVLQRLCQDIRDLVDEV